MKRRKLPSPIRRKKAQMLGKVEAKNVRRGLTLIDALLEDRVSSFQETMSQYTSHNKMDRKPSPVNDGGLSIRSSRSSFYNYEKMLS